MFGRHKHSYGIIVLIWTSSLFQLKSSSVVILDTCILVLWFYLIKSLARSFTDICFTNVLTRGKMAEPFCFPMQWMLSLDQKKTGISWLVSTLLLMFTAVIAGKCWVGNTKELTRHLRSTRKENSSSKSRKLLRRTGSIPFCNSDPQSIHSSYDVDLFMLWDVPMYRKYSLLPI